MTGLSDCVSGKQTLRLICQRSWMIQRNLEQLKNEFDICIIGGGITGICVAREAAERGLKTILVEKNDFGWATSSATSKLIHGGLRYLENFEFGLVRESLRERHVLSCIAGHLVKPLPFLIPIYDWSKPGRALLQMGLWTYDSLSFDRNFNLPESQQIPGSKWISAEETLQREKSINPIGLQGSFLYYDLQSLYPERLTLAFAKTATQAGAQLFNHMKVTGFESTTGSVDPSIASLSSNSSSSRNSIGVSGVAPRKIQSIQVQDTLNQKKYTIKSKIFVNASGPWMDIILGLAGQDALHKLSRSTGIHFLTEKVDNGSAILLRTKQGRHFFVLPWQGMSLIGPTDLPYEGHPDDLAPRSEEIDLLLSDLNETMPVQLTKKMIKHVIVGIRPLIFSQGNTYQASRKSEIYDHDDEGLGGLFSVAGGKWTTSRQLGVDVLDTILKKPKYQSLERRNVDTSKTPLVGSSGFAVSPQKYEEVALREFYTPRISPDIHRYLVSLYGTENGEIAKLVKKDADLAKPLSDTTKDIAAQIVFAIEYESAKTLSDILNRRLTIGQFGYPGNKVVLNAAKIAGKYLKWTASRIKKEMETYKAEFPLALIK